MCEWNTAHPDDPVIFAGFDVQQPWYDYAFTREFLDVAAPDDAAGLMAGRDECDGVESTTADDYYAHINPDGTLSITGGQNRACIDGLDAVETYLIDHHDDLVAATTERELAEVELAVVGARSWQGAMYWSSINAENPAPDEPRSLEERDRGMAHTLLWQMEWDYPGARVVVWAHNTHIAENHDEVVGFYGGASSMGTFLGDDLLADYFTVMLTGYEVSINWPGVGVGPAALPEDHHLESSLHELGLDIFLADVKAEPDHLPFDPGVAHPFAHYFGTGVPRDTFDALVFIDVVEMMSALLW
jgi:erythromycin esterase-like protein